MHLGFIVGPFVPHNLISTQQSPVSLTKFQMEPRLKILMSSWSKKGTQIYYFFSLKKVPASESVPRSLIVGSFVPHNLISTQQSPAPLPKFQLAPRFKILMSSGSKKGTQIYYPFHSKSPSQQIPSRFPNGAPIERDTRLQDIFTSLLIYLFNISFGSPVKELSLQVPLMESSRREMPRS
jgi:hypothetical protein